MMRILCVFVFAVALALAGCAALPAPQAPDQVPDQVPAPPPPPRQSPAPAEPLPIDPVVPAFLTRLEARDAGVDRAGHLWAWGEGEVRVHAPSGEVVAVLPVPSGTAAVDADRGWGLAALAAGGRELRWARPGGEILHLSLSGEVADVAWISADEVAVSPVASGDRVEIWDLERRERVAAFGEETPIAVPEAGAYLLRHVLLEHDAARGRLWTLESFTGDLQVFDAEGRGVARAQLDNPRRAEIERSLRESEEQLRQRGQASPARYVVLRLAVDESGTGRVVTACSEDARRATVVALSPQGALRMQTIDLSAPCCSRVFTVWQDGLVLHASPAVPGPGCTVVQPL